MITNKMNLPKPFVDAATSNHEYKPNRYSVTEVLGGTCEAILKRRHHGEQDEDVSERMECDIIDTDSCGVYNTIML